MSGELNLYDSIEAAIIAQIKKYKPGITVSDAGVMGETPDYPFITYSLYEDDEQASFNDPENESFYVRLQLKAISDNQNEAKTLGHWLRKLLILQQPKVDLLAQAIVVDSVTTLASSETYLDVDWQFSSGADYRLMVQDNYVDETQTGTISTVNPDFNFKRSDNK